MEQADGIREKLPQFLPGLLEEQYGAALAETIIQGFSVRRRVTLRANTLKTSIDEVRTALNAAGILFRAVPWYPDALILEDADENAVRALPLYDEGKIYLQSLSSMLPPLVLEPRPGADILDMAAAPGGKTTQMAALSNNRAHITACEMNPIRAKRLQYNIEKQGASCVYLMQKDARTLDDFFAFDQILLDAPCSGSGVLDLRDERLLASFTRKLIDKSVKAQRALLKKAIRLLKKGQEMVYSTCSVLACENEDIIASALSGGGVELIPIASDRWQELPLLPVQLEGTLCVAPDELFEGFFLAKLRAI
ncbi:MAG: RsmB/NOP family class I SAM-dependent RNA methyltransferase [Agathobacter sp.]|nr:RsmB/NOP family class I SAM-dependent RNA methyltransferase [Agathobacter sp.]